MIGTNLLKEIAYFLISFLLLFSSIIPFSAGSLYDYTFLLLAFIFWIFRVLDGKNINITRLRFFIGIYFLISFIHLTLLFFADSVVFNFSLPIFLRINALLIFIDLFLDKKSTDINLFRKKNLFLYPFISMSAICSIWAFWNSLYGMSWRIGFPLYSEGYDPHVFGPAMACSFITLAYVFFNIDKYFDVTNRLIFIRIILLISIITCFAAVVFCGSRGGLLILAGALFTYIILSSLKNTSKFFVLTYLIKKSSLYLLVFFSFIFVVCFNFISNTSEKLGLLFFRTFDLLPLLLGTDPSRGNQFENIYEGLSSSFNNLIPNPSFFIDEGFMYRNTDVGISYFIYNQGFILFLVFLCIYFFIFNNLRKINKISASLLSAGLILLIFGSATLFIPRFYLIYLFSIRILAENKYLNFNQYDSK